MPALKRTRTLLAGFVAGILMALAGVAVAQELSTDNIRVTSVSGGTPIEGLRPTGVGLPEVGVESTAGAGDYPPALEAYHDSGQYSRDLAAVGRTAKRFLVRRADRVRDRARKRCRRGGPCRKPRLAIVFDIDETSLSNYDEIAATDFANASTQLAISVFGGDSPPIEATQRVYETALANDVFVFFITGRPESPEVRSVTENNLRSAGYESWQEVILKSTSESTIEYKSGARAEIEEGGFQIIANLGDQESDLAGGSADRAFKLPNPYYFIP